MDDSAMLVGKAEPVDYLEKVEDLVTELVKAEQATDALPRRSLFIKYHDRDDGFWLTQDEDSIRDFSFNVTLEPWQSVQLINFLRTLPKEPEND